MGKARPEGAYAWALGRFLAWGEMRSLTLGELEPFLVASSVEELAAKLAAASVKQHLAALRMLFRLPGRRPSSGPQPGRSGARPPARHPHRQNPRPPRGRAPPPPRLHHRRGAGRPARPGPPLGHALQLLPRQRGGGVECPRLRAPAPPRLSRPARKGRPVHSRTAEALDAYLAASGLAAGPEAPLFQSFAGKTGHLTGEALSARSALRAVKQRAAAAGLGDDVGCHSCRAIGITNYLL